MTNLTGTSTPDRIIGSAGSDVLYGSYSDDPYFDPDPVWDPDPTAVLDADTLYGHQGHDIFFAGHGDDLQFGGRGGDRFAWVFGNDTIFGGKGRDTIEYYAPVDATAGSITGGAGRDQLICHGFGGAQGDRFSLQNPDRWQLLPDGTRITGVEQLTLFHGSPFACTIIGGDWSDTFRTQGYLNGTSQILGRGGDDAFTILTGGDTLRGGRGDDHFALNLAGIYTQDGIEHTGGNHLYGGPGTDVLWLVMFGLTSGAVLNLQTVGPQVFGPNTLISGFEQIDLWMGSPYGDTVTGAALADTLTGDAGPDWFHGCGDADQLLGGDDDDRLFGGTGDDTLDGGSGANLLMGGRGNDRLVAGGASDTLTGGPGADVFVLHPGQTSAVITDFATRDSILLYISYSGRRTLRPEDFCTTPVAQDANDRILYDIAIGALWYDPDGNGSLAAALIGHLTPGTALTASDFLIL